jgi:hypothetical protein
MNPLRRLFKDSAWLGRVLFTYNVLLVLLVCVGLVAKAFLP